MADTQLFAQLQPFTLAGAGATSGDTSIILKSMQSIDGVNLTMANFGTKAFGTLEPGSLSYEEQISFTGITQNGDGTATLTGVKNVGFLAPYTESSGVSKSHAGGVSFVISNTSGFYNELTSKQNDETISGIYTFTDPNVPRMDTAHTYAGGQEEYFATKRYVDSVALAGAPDASTTTKGVTKLTVAPALATNPIAVGANDWAAAANYGISKLSVAPASATVPIAVGDNDGRVPSQTENDALVGTSGTPSTSNKFVTNEDTSNGFDQEQNTRDASQKVGEADATGKNLKLAQSFIPTYSVISGVALYKIADTGSFTGTVTVALYANDSGTNTPTGAALATVTISNANWLLLNAGLFNAVFSSPYTATVGSTYWVVVSTSTADNANHINLGTNSAGGYANGSSKYNNTTDGWVAIAAIDLTFKTLRPLTDKVVRYDDNGRVFGQVYYGTDAGSTDAYEINVVNYPGTLQVGDHFIFKAATANTGACTLNVNLTGATAIKKYVSTAMDTNDILSNQTVEVVYDGTNFQLISPISNLPKRISFTASRVANAGNGAVTYAHGLGYTPNWVKCAMNASASANPNSFGAYESANKCIYRIDGTTAGADTVLIRHEDGSGNIEKGSITALDATNITITWTATGTPAATTLNLLFECGL